MYWVSVVFHSRKKKKERKRNNGKRKDEKKSEEEEEESERERKTKKEKEKKEPPPFPTDLDFVRTMLARRKNGRKKQDKKKRKICRVCVRRVPLNFFSRDRGEGKHQKRNRVREAFPFQLFFLVMGGK